RPLATGIGAGDGPVVPANRNRAHRPLSSVVADLQPPVRGEAGHRQPAGCRVPDRVRKAALAADFGERFIKPRFKVHEQRRRLPPAYGQARGFAEALDPLLDREQAADRLSAAPWRAAIWWRRELRRFCAVHEPSTRPQSTACRPWYLLRRGR